MQKIRPGFILPSAVFTISPRQVKNYQKLDKSPEVGDVVYGRVTYVGEHSSLENKEGRTHMINDGNRALFIYGNRYAPDAFEGIVPDQNTREVDLLARSGLVGQMREKNTATKDPTKVEVLGFVLDRNGDPLNTRNFPKGLPKNPLDKRKKRAKAVIHVGTSMNSGKSTSAIACCWALSAMGHAVRASKVTGTASLKDILHMQDAGAESVSDFTHLGFPSTYMIDDKAPDRFRRGQSKVLIATDVAARGIDIHGITHVADYDIPGTFDDYVHRIGRTGRANESGDAITFVSPQELKDLNMIERGLGKNLPRTDWKGSVTVLSLYKPANSKKGN